MQNNYTFSTLILKTLASTFAGILGSLLILLFFIGFGTVLSPILQSSQNPDVYLGTVFIFLLLVMIFITTLVSSILNIVASFLIEKEKYKNLSTSIYQIVILNSIVLLLFIPIYFIAKSIGVEVLSFAVALHVILGAQLTALTSEIISNYRYAILGVYGTGFAIITSLAVLLLLYNIIPNISILLFLSLPIVLGSISFMQGIVTLIHSSLAKLYDKEFLVTDSLYGDDYGKEIVEKKEKTKDDEGADFMRDLTSSQK